MYDEFFGLTETPFSIAPDPRFLYMSERHREALAHLLYGISTDGGFVLLSGEVGTGKTTISRCLLDQVPGNANIAMILNPKLMAGELLATICDEFGIEYPEGNTSIKVFVDAINKFLLANHANGRKTVVMIEESQNLKPEVLEQLRLLTNLETHQRKLLQIIMIGQPELLDLLARPELRQLEQRVTARYHLMPLSLQDTADYVRHRLSVAGVKIPVFSPAMLKKVHKLTGGIPRKINLLCDRAMLGAYARNQHHVDAKVLRQAALEVFGDEDHIPQNQSRKRWWVIGGLAAIMIGGGIAATQYMHNGFINIGAHKKSSTVAQSSAQSGLSKQSLNLMDSKLVAGNPTAAYTSLFAAWHLKYPGNGTDPCEFAQNNGLACLTKENDFKELAFQELTGLNRPAVVELKNQRGKNVYATFSELDDKSAILKAAQETYHIALDDLLKRWTGSYTLLWRVPPHFSGAIKPGTEGPDVDWLAQQMANITGKPKSVSYDDGLKQQVRTFQSSVRLLSDGIAGIHTLIHINTATDHSVPQLVKAQEKTSATQFSRFDMSALWAMRKQKASS